MGEAKAFTAVEQYNRWKEKKVEKKSKVGLIAIVVLVVLVLLLLIFARQAIWITYLSMKSATAINNGSFEKAAGIRREIIAIEPDVAEHYWELGTICISRKDKIGVSRQIKKLRKMGRDDLADSLKKAYRLH